MKYIITIVALFSIFSNDVLAQATPNAGFENWTSVSAFPSNYDVPDNWDNANPQTAIVSTYSCEKATGGDVHTGSAAVKLITKNIFGNDVPGVVTTGTLPSSAGNPITGGMPYTLRPDSIVGWYKYTPQGGDNGFAEITLFGSAANNADTVAKATFETPTATVGTYTRFSAPLVYFSSNAVANSIWLLSSSNSDVSLAVGSEAFYDDLELIINPVAVADVSIAQTVGSSTICVGESVTFTATPTSGGTAPVYQWQVDGGNVGTDSTAFTTATLTDGQVVTCIMTSNLGGVTGSPATSNTITMTVIAVPATPVASSNTPICEGTTINLTTSTVSGATYSWTGPNSFISSTQNPTLTSSTSVMTGTYNVAVTVNGCTSAIGTTNVVVDVPVIPAVDIAITVGGNPTCTGDSVTYTATPTNGGTPIYQWMLNGANVGSNSPTYSTTTLSDGNVVTCVMTSSLACVTSSLDTSNAIVMTVNAPVSASVTVSESFNPICTGDNVTFSAAPVNEGGTPVYQWQLNGANVGANSTTYSTAGLSDGDSVTCVMTSSLTCVSGSPTISNTIVMSVSGALATSANITESSDSICTGDNVIFTITPVNGGGTPVYQWQVNGGNAGSNSPTYASTTLSDGDVVTCILTSSLSCATGSPATSNSITISVVGSLVASVSISASADTICTGEGVTFTAAPTNGGTTPLYQWFVNSILIAGADSNAFATSTLSDGDQITCLMTSSSSCVTSPSTTSNSVVLTVNAPAAVSVTVSASSDTICAGDNVAFTAVPVNGGGTPSYQWQVNGINTGTNSSTYSSTTLNDGNAVTCIMTSSLTCITGSPVNSNAITISVASAVTPVVAIVLSSGTNPMCAGESVEFTASPTNGGTTPSYQWQVDGANVGTDNETYTSSSLTDAQVIACIMTSSSGCASPATASSNAITLTVNPNPATPFISENGAELTSSAASGNQWYMNGSPISGATNQIYTVTQDGAYTVMVTEVGCSSSVSAVSNIILIGIGEISKEMYFNIYPNPSEGNINVSFNATLNATYILEIRNVLGQLVYQETIADFHGQYSRQMNVSQYGTGVYVTSLRSEQDGMSISKVFIQK